MRRLDEFPYSNYPLLLENIKVTRYNAQDVYELTQY